MHQFIFFLRIRVTAVIDQVKLDSRKCDLFYFPKSGLLAQDGAPIIGITNRRIPY